jgi:hypothetical protein
VQPPCRRQLVVLTVLAVVPLLAACGDLAAPRKGAKEDKIVGKMTRDIMNMEDVQRDHPDWVVENPEVEGNDPLTQTGTAYDALTHQAAQLSWTHWLAIHKVSNDDRLPTFAEVERYVQQESNGLPKVRPYRHWVYDPATGELFLMLDKVERNKIWKERGIAIPAE